MRNAAIGTPVWEPYPRLPLTSRVLLPNNEVASANAVPTSASLAMPEACGPSPPETRSMPRVSEKTAPRLDVRGAGSSGSPSNRSTGRVDALPRSTHFQSSVIRLPLSTGGYMSWIELSSVLRFTASMLRMPGWTRMPFFSGGNESGQRHANGIHVGEQPAETGTRRAGR